MPANLTPQYLEAEQAFREAESTEDKVRCLEEMIRIIPKHKGTDHLQADLRRKLSRLREQAQQEAQKSKKSHSFRIRKEGAGQIALAGPPNSGKSQLVETLTGAGLEVAPYPFTTRAPQPAMMPYLDVQVQLIDLPPLSAEHEEHWVADLVKAAEAVLVVVNLEVDPLEALAFTLGRLEQRKLFPVRALPEELPPGALARPMLVACTGVDHPERLEEFELFRELSACELPMLPVSGVTGYGLEHLKDELWRMLEVIRVYSKPPGRKLEERDAPYVLPRGSTVLAFAEAVHRELAESLKYARIWSAGKYDGQMVNRDEPLEDGDMLELH